MSDTDTSSRPKVHPLFWAIAAASKTLQCLYAGSLKEHGQVTKAEQQRFIHAACERLAPDEKGLLREVFADLQDAQGSMFFEKLQHAAARGIDRFGTDPDDVRWARFDHTSLYAN